MDDLEKIEWQMPEYEEKERNNDWFWALGIVVLAGSITSVIFSNYFFAVLILLSGFLVVLFSIKAPDMVTYELSNRGLKIRNRLFPYKSIKSFWVQVETPPTLFIKSDRMVMPIISMPIEFSMAKDIKDMLLENGVTPEEMREHFSEKVMESIGF